MATTYTPSPTHARSVEIVPLDSMGIRAGPCGFAVRVPDTSLRDMALLPGDVVVCEHGMNPCFGVLSSIWSMALIPFANLQTRRSERKNPGPALRPTSGP